MNMSTRSDSAVPLEARPLAPAVDLMALVRGMWRRKLLWLVIVVLAVGAALAVLKLATPRYSAGTMVLIGSADAAFANLSFESTQPRAVDERQVASQEQVIRSRELALRVVDSLGPDARAELGAVPDELSPVKQAMIDAGVASDPRKVPEDRRVLESYYEGLTVYALPNSNAIAIQFTAADPDLAAAVANAVADNYVTYTRDIQLEMTGQARDWLAGQIEVLRAQVSESEKAVETYRAENGLVQGSRASLDTESLTELNNQIVQAAATSAEARARADAIRDLLRSRGTVDASLEVLNSNLIQRLTEQQVTLKAQLADLSTTYLPSHPRIEAIGREIGDLDRQLRTEALKIADGLEQQARIAAAREASLRNSLEELKADASSNSLQEVELRALEREAEADRTLLQNMLTRYGDASTREGANAQPALARVISHAEPPLDPSFPRPVPLLGLALAGGAMVGLVLVFLLEVFSPSRVVAPGPGGTPDTPKGTGRSKSADKAHAAPDETGPGDEAPSAARAQEEGRREPLLVAGGPVARPGGYDLLATGGEGLAERGDILLAHARDWRVASAVRRILVTGAPEMVTEISSAALTLARAMARQGAKCVLIDADMRNPNGLRGGRDEGQPGLSDLLTGAASFSDCMGRDAETGLHTLASGRMLRDAHPLLSSRRVEIVLDTLDEAYDAVLVKAGPLGQPFSGAGLADKCQAVIVLVPDTVGEAMMTMLAQSLRRQGVTHVAFAPVTLEAKGARVRGTAA